jgi:CRISPR/Cas system-associated exonuclease Cas4 (RecB family)
VRERIKHASLTLADRAKAEKESLSLLLPYLQAHKAEWPKSLRVEHFFGTSPPLQFEGLSLVGKVDNIIQSGSNEKSVCVIDYKTGRRKTQGELVGKPGDVRQPVQQLVFYALLAELDPTFQYTVTEGEFAFLRPTDAGKYKPVRFEITPERSESLKATLRQVREEIHTLAFLDHAPCGECGVCDHFGFAAPLHEQD